MLTFWEQNEHIINILNLCVGSFITIVAVFGNFLTVIAILKFKHLQTKSNILIFSLSCSDVVCVIYWMILEVINVTLKPCKTNLEIYIWPYMTHVTFFKISVLHLVTISIERYIAIFHGLYYNKLLSKKRFGILVGFCWVFPFVMDLATIPWIPYWNKEDHVCFYGEIWTKVNVYINIIIYIFCWPMVLFIYFCIYKAAKFQTKRIHAFQIGGKTEGRKTDTKATKTLSLLLAAFIVAWSPYFITCIVKFFIPHMDISLFVILYHITFKIGLVNSAVNFFIYAYNKKDFKNAYKQLLSMGCRPKP